MIDSFISIVELSLAMPVSNALLHQNIFVIFFYGLSPIMSLSMVARCILLYISLERSRLNKLKISDRTNVI